MKEPRIYDKEYSEVVDKREDIIRNVSRELQLPVGTIKAVIENQFKTAEKAIDTCTIVEIAGFGKFILKENLLKFVLVKFNNSVNKYKGILETEEVLSDMRRTGLVTRIEILEKGIIYLSRKQDEFKNK